MKNIMAIFLKQISDTMKNKTVLIQFVMFPVLTVIMENCIELDNMPEHFFAKLFAVMFVGMAPLTSMASIIAEEKEKNTLRALMMSNVRPAEYLLGIGSYLFICCMAGTAVFAASCGYSGKELISFILIMAAGIILSETAGAVIGIASNDQMSATAISIPVMIVLSFLPMLSMFNETIGKVAKVFYSQQMSLMINGEQSTSGIIITLVNMLVLVAAFTVMYRKKGLE